MNQKLYSLIFLFFLLFPVILVNPQTNVGEENFDDIGIPLRGYPSDLGTTTFEGLGTTIQNSIQENSWELGESLNITIDSPRSLGSEIRGYSTSPLIETGGLTYTYESDNIYHYMKDTTGTQVGDKEYVFYLIYAIPANQPGTMYVETYGNFSGTGVNATTNEVVLNGSVNSESISMGTILLRVQINATWYFNEVLGWVLTATSSFWVFNYVDLSWNIVDGQGVVNNGDLPVFEYLEMWTDHVYYEPDTIISYPRVERQQTGVDSYLGRLQIENFDYNTEINITMPNNYAFASSVPDVTVSIDSDNILSVTNTIPVTYQIDFNLNSTKQYLSISQFKSYDFEGSGGDNLNSTIVSSGAFSERKTSGNLNFEDDDLPLGYYYGDWNCYVETAPTAIVLQYYDGSSWINATSASVSTTDRWQQLFAYLHPTGVSSGYTIRIVIDGSGIVFYDDINFNTVNHQVETTSWRKIKVSGQTRNWDGYDNPLVDTENVYLAVRDRTGSSVIVETTKTTDSNGNWEWEIDTSSYSELQDQREILVQSAAADSIQFDSQFDSNLKGYWDFDEGTGTTAEDKTSNNHDATLSTSPDWISGKFINALDFESSSSEYLTVSDHNDFTFTNGTDTFDVAFSISAWIKIEATGSTMRIIGKYGATGEKREWLFGIDSTGDLAVEFCHYSAGSTRIGRKYDTALSTASWYHVAMTYDGSESENGIDLYLDGVVVDDTSRTLGSYIGMTNTASDLYIGSIEYSGAMQEFFDGIIDDVRVYSKELTQPEVQDIMWLTSPKSYFTPQYPNYWQYEYESGNKFDFSEETSDGWAFYTGGSSTLTTETGYLNLNVTSTSSSYTWYRQTSVSIDTSIYTRIIFRAKGSEANLRLQLNNGGASATNTMFTLNTTWSIVEIPESDFQACWDGDETVTDFGFIFREDENDGNFDGGEKFWLDFITPVHYDTPSLSVADSYAWCSSSNNSFTYRTEIDDVVQGYYSDLTYFSTDQSVASHTINATVYDDTSRSGICFLPGTSVTSSYTVSTDFYVSVENIYLSDDYVNVFVTASKDGTYIIYENDSSVGSGSFDKDGTAISSSRNTTYGSLIELAYKFTNSTDNIWFNTSYSVADYTHLIVTISTPILVDGRISIGITSNLGDSQVNIDDDSIGGTEVDWENEGVFSWFSNTVGENNLTIQVRNDANGDSDYTDSGETWSDTVSYHLYELDLEIVYAFLSPYTDEGATFAFMSNHRGANTTEYRCRTQDGLGWSQWLSEDDYNGTYDFTFVNCDLDTTYNFSVEIRNYITDESPAYQYKYLRIEYTPYSPDPIVSNPQPITPKETTTTETTTPAYAEVKFQNPGQILVFGLIFFSLFMIAWGGSLWAQAYYLTNRLPDEGMMDFATRKTTEGSLKAADKATLGILGLFPEEKEK